MYSDTDIEDAVTAGVLTPEAAAAFRAHVSADRASPAVDDENFRLLTGFNDIFVAIAGVLLLVGAAWLGGEAHPAVGGGLVAALAWGLAEYFTRVRRMALPSIIFLIAFVGGVMVLAAGVLVGENSEKPDTIEALLIALSAAIAAGGAAFHWRRFKVPITIAAGAAAVAGVLLALAGAALGDLEPIILPLLFVCGIAIFAFAMRWDMSDTARQTRRSDVAFWLHLLAAPLIVHPVFAWLGLVDGEPGVGGALIVIGLYIAMGVVALAIDRRALLVAALGYVLYAIGALFREFGAVSLNVALTALVIGSALLLLSAFWHTARSGLVKRLPETLAARLPG